jgi:hypothetical protein
MQEIIKNPGIAFDTSE